MISATLNKVSLSQPTGVYMSGIQDIQSTVLEQLKAVVNQLREIPAFETAWQAVLKVRLLKLKLRCLIKGENDPIVTAQRLYHKGDYELLLIQLHPLLELHPDSHEVWSLIGLANHKLGSQKSAVIAFKEALKNDPDNCSTLYNLARQYVLLNEPAVALGYIEMAETVLQEKHQQDPENNTAYDIDLLYLKATVYELEHNSDKAIEIYNQVLEFEPEHPARCFLAELHASKDNMELAMELLIKHLEIYPTDIDAIHLKCTFLGQLGQWDEVISLAEKLIEVNPHRSEFYNHLSLAYYTKDDYDKAIGFCQQALEIDPEYAVALSNLGYTYLRTERWSDAKEVFEQYLKLAPEDDPNYIEVQYQLETIEEKLT